MNSTESLAGEKHMSAFRAIQDESKPVKRLVMCNEPSTVYGALLDPLNTVVRSKGLDPSLTWAGKKDELEVNITSISLGVSVTAKRGCVNQRLLCEDAWNRIAITPGSAARRTQRRPHWMRQHTQRASRMQNTSGRTSACACSAPQTQSTRWSPREYSSLLKENIREGVTV